MGIRHDVEEGLDKYEVTTIEGQPTDEDLNQLTKELTNAAGSVATQNGGGEHGHVGMVVEEAEYITFSRGNTRFVIPINPGPYPLVVDNDAVIRERQIAEHKAEIVEYETYLGVENWMRRKIVKAVDREWLAEIESETMGFNHLTPMALLTHLRNVGGSLDHMDVTELITNLQKPWDGIETPVAYFARGDKYERQLLKVGQPRNPTLRLAFAQSTFQTSGEFEPALREWEAKPAVDRTFANFRVFMQQEYGKHHKQNKSTVQSVGHGIANSVTEKQLNQVDVLEAQAMIFVEFANSLQEQQQKQFKEMMSVLQATLAGKNTPTSTTSATPNVGAQTEGKRKKKLCPHCNTEVYHKPEKCFELEANVAKRPANWVSKKST